MAVSHQGYVFSKYKEQLTPIVINTAVSPVYDLMDSGDQQRCGLDRQLQMSQ